jgi:hypothetical protein
LEAHAKAQQAALDAQQHEIVRRQGLRWWLRLPFQRFGLIKPKQ